MQLQFTNDIDQVHKQNMAYVVRTKNEKIKWIKHIKFQETSQ